MCYQLFNTLSSRWMYLVDTKIFAYICLQCCLAKLCFVTRFCTVAFNISDININGPIVEKDKLEVLRQNIDITKIQPYLVLQRPNYRKRELISQQDITCTYTMPMCISAVIQFFILLLKSLSDNTK